MENQSKTKLNKVVSTLLIFLIILMQTIVVPVSKSNSDTNEYLKIYITNPNGTLNQGDTIYLTINAVKEITAIDAILSYDWDVFEQVTDASQCTILKSGWKILSGFGVDSSVSNQTYLPAQHEQTLDTGDLIQIPFTLKKTVSKVSISLIDMEVAYTLGGSPATPEDITATYEPSGHTIKYNKNTTDAVNGMPSEDGKKSQGIAYTIASEPTRNHYDCIGWGTTNNATTATYRGGDQYTTDADLTLYALWKLKHPTLTVNPNGGTVDGNTATYTKEGDYNTTVNIPNPTKTPNGYVVKFDANGGTVDQLQTISTTSFSGWTGSGTSNLSGTTYTFGDNNQELKANYTQDAITLPTPTKTGSTFKGWYTATTGGTKLGNAGEQWTPTANNMTISAQWNEQTYTLTINPNGGTYGGTTDPTTVSQAYNTSYTVKTVTPPTGKTITFKDDDGTTTITTVTQTKNFDKWTLEPQNSQDIGKEGSLNSTQTTYTFGTANAQLTASYTDNQIELPDPGNKLGYTFDGWYTSRTGTNKVGNAGDIYNGANTTLYAHWTANTYTVTLDPTNGGTINGTSGTKTVTVAYGQTYDSSTGWPADSTVKKSGYDFDGWYNGNTKISGTDIVNITRNTTLTAKWLGAEIEITLDANGGKFSDDTTSKTATVRNEETYGTAISTQPTRTGYTFKGWYMDPANDSTKIESSTTVNLTGPTTLKAKWETVKSTLTVNPNGGTWQGNTTTQTYTQDYNTTKEIPDPTVTSGIEVTFDAGTNGTVNGNGTVTLTKTFDKWTDSGTANLTPITSGGNTYKFTDTDTTLTATYKNVAVTLPTASKPGYTFKNWVDASGNTITADNIYTNITEPTKLTAKWLGAEITITLDANSGKFSDGTTTKTAKVRNEGTYGTAVSTQPTRTGYTFKGWYLDPANDSTKIESTTTVNLTGPTTLKAKWEAIKSTLTVNPNGGTWQGNTTTQTYTQDYNTTKEITDPTVTSGITVTFSAGTNGTLNGNGTVTLTKTFDKWTGSGAANLTPITSGGNTYKFTETDTTLTATYKNGAVTLPTATKPGYTFKNWVDTNGNTITADNIYTNVTTPTTLTATYEGNSYNVNFNSDGGTSVQSIQVKNGEPYGTLPTSTKKGYTLDGWYDDNGNKIESTTTVNLTADQTLTAHWTIKQTTLTVDPDSGLWEGSTQPQQFKQDYESTKQITNDPVANSGFTVTFDTNGTTIKNNGATSFVQTRQFDHWELTSGDGTWNATSKTFTYGDTDSTLKAIYIDGETTLPELDEKTGNDFKGWYKDDGTKVGNPGDKYTAKKNETLHAKFDPKKYTVTYKNDDGTEFQTETVEYGKTVQKAGITPTSKTITPRTGYKTVFTGWKDENKLQNITSDVEVTATFTEKPIEYTITYENTKGVTNDENPKTYTVETPNENLKLKDLSNSGYFIFLGWFDGNGDNANKITSIDKTKLENITLYAHWLNSKLYLSSQKYKIGENDIDNYEDGDIYLDKIEPKTTVEQFKNNCDTNGEITVYDKDGNALGNDDLVGTGMTLKDVKDDQSITLTLIVMGDLNGDGKATIVDLTRLNMWLIGARAETEIQIKAADVSHNGKVTVTDLVKLNQSEELIAIPGREKLTYTKPNRR